MSKREAKKRLKEIDAFRKAMRIPPWEQQAAYLSGFVDGWNAQARKRSKP